MELNSEKRMERRRNRLVICEASESKKRRTKTRGDRDVILGNVYEKYEDTKAENEGLDGKGETSRHEHVGYKKSSDETPVWHVDVGAIHTPYFCTNFPYS